MAEWSCSGLQSRLRRFDSDPSLHTPYRPTAQIKERNHFAAQRLLRAPTPPQHPIALNQIVQGDEKQVCKC